MALLDDPKWMCPQCTYSNWLSSPYCILCTCQKPPEIIQKTGASRSRVQNQATTTRVKPSDNRYFSTGEASCSPHIMEDSASAWCASPTACGSDKWTCHSCTYANWANATKCVMCKTSRSSGGEGVRSEQAYAGCGGNAGAVGGRDTPLHTALQPQAKASKKFQKPSDNPPHQKWRCPRCTFDNWTAAVKCAMCQTSKMRTPSPPLTEHNPATSKLEALPQGDISSLSFHHKNANASGLICAPSPTLSNRRAIATIDGSEQVPLKACINEIHQIRNRLSSDDWLFLNACLGVVNNDPAAVKKYLRSSAGDKSRQLTRDECVVLNNPSKFNIGSTLVQLAIRFHQSDILSLILTPASSEARKRLPSQSSPDIAASIRREVGLLLRQHKGDWPCQFLTQIATFALPAEIHSFHLIVQKKLMDEILDREVERELEAESAVINWNAELVEDLGSQLYPLWNRTAGDCLLDSVMQATWGVVDRDNTLRTALADSLVDGASRFYERWKEAEQLLSQTQGFILDDEQLKQDWSAIVALADQKGKSLEQTHVFALAHILRRPIIVYGVKMVKNFRGENLGFANFEGVYLPLLWESSFCSKMPISLGYTRGHFSALVSVVGSHKSGDGVWCNSKSCDSHVTYLPLVNRDGKLLPVHFLTELEVGNEEKLLNEYCDCHVTKGATLVARQEISHWHQSALVSQLVDSWLEQYRRMNDQQVSSSAAQYDSDS